MVAPTYEQVVRSFFALLTEGGVGPVSEKVIHADYASEEGLDFPSVHGPRVFDEEVAAYRALYKELRFEMKHAVLDGDVTIATFEARGISATETFINRAGKEEAKRLQADGVALVRIADGKIIGSRLFWPRKPLHP